MSARRHSRHFSFFFLLLATLLVAEQGWVHECPMHARATAGAALDAATSHDAHAGHGAATTSHHEQAPASPHTECNCLGDCTGPLVTYAHNDPIDNVPAPAAIKNDRPRVDTTLRAIANAPYRLPFANGPPAHA